MDYTGIKLKKSDILRKLQSALSNKRYLHSLGVAEEAVRLAERYGADTGGAEAAGLLHDCAKCMPDRLKLQLCKEYHIKLNEAMRERPDLTHSFLGAEIAKREYGVSNEEILEAIRYHTTGRREMGKIEKIIYLADFIEPNRTPFDTMEKIRELSYKDLDEAVTFSLGESIKYVRNGGRKVHGLTLEAFEYYKNLINTKEE